ncbi:uncharacterized protein ARMOST_11234 [Armillaria ostoyae]|uniref:Uncharacterized protein n=1 Tax=Armillaria ostoyae TaxID=47428 RepID=A0A284RGL2_ARMOS|nr:uncharacterized protein ARMOST_11234 [Armillaria ostoyae]
MAAKAYGRQSQYGKGGDEVGDWTRNVPKRAATPDCKRELCRTCRQPADISHARPLRYAYDFLVVRPTACLGLGQNLSSTDAWLPRSATIIECSKRGYLMIRPPYPRTAKRAESHLLILIPQITLKVGHR